MSETKQDFSSAKKLRTILDFVRYSFTQLSKAEVFYGHGTDNAWDEAFALVLDTLSLPANVSQSLLPANLTKPEKKQLCQALDKRINQRIPLAYITNKTSFAGIDFYIDERALIPRSPIAELIENAFSPWVSSTPKKILDMCTGGGCIALACAYHMPEAEVDAADISPEALAVAQINLERHQLSDRVRFYQSDLYQSVPDELYDVIVSNPPYVDKRDMDSMPEEFHHEPSLALESGDDGLDCSRLIIQQAMQYLADDGVLVLEVGNSAPALEQAFPDLPMVWIDLEQGGEGVCVIEKRDLAKL